ncbi:MAG TPA: hypothetical protein VHO24_02955 [Opitutaceae bacterium]|nr:hypothetical protein [Opitutaceae bacterium]
MKPSSKWPRFWTGCAILPVLVVTAVFLQGISRGFDFTDEGFYYLSFSYPGHVSDNQTSFHLFGAKIFALLGRNIVAMRVWTLLAVFAGTGIFLHGAWRFVDRFAPDLGPRPEQRNWCNGAALVAAFLGFATSPAAFSYNFQNALCLLAATGFLLRASAEPPNDVIWNRSTLLPLGAFGIIAAFQFFVKFSSCVVLAFVGSSFFFLTSQKRIRQKTALGGMILGCAGAVALVYFTLFQSPGRWWQGIMGTAQGIMGGYATQAIHRYGGEFAELVQHAMRNFVPVWVVAVPTLLAVLWLRRKPRRQAFIAAFGGAWTLAHLLWLMQELEYLTQPGLEFFCGSLILFVLLATVSSWAKPRTLPALPSRWRLPVAGAFFFSLPYIGSFGTTNFIHTNCLYQMSPWFVLAALLLLEVDRIWNTPWPSRLGLSVLVTVACSQFYLGYWQTPYRVAGSRSEQRVPTTIGQPATTLLLDPRTHTFVVESRRLLHEQGFKPGDDLLVFFNLPGFVFAMGGQSPGHPWYFQGSQRSLDLDLMRLRFIDPARLRRAAIVCNDAGEEYLTLLRAAGLNFPQDYQRITPPMISPFTGVPFEIWKPK